MSKKLCDLKKLVKSDLKRYLQYVDKPAFICTSCGRVANEKKLVCEPRKIKD